MTRTEAKRATSLSQQTRDVAYLRVAVEDLLEQVVVDDGEVEAFYQNNPGSFMTEETVDIGYIEIKRDDFLGVVEVT